MSSLVENYPCYITFLKIKKLENRNSKFLKNNPFPRMFNIPNTHLKNSFIILKMSNEELISKINVFITKKKTKQYKW